MAKITINTYWDLVGEDLIQAMQAINESPLTTRNHYGKYLSILTDLKPLFSALFLASLISFTN